MANKKPTIDKDFVRTRSMEYVLCRALGHGYHIDGQGPASKFNIATKFGERVKVRKLICFRCGLERYDFLTGGYTPAIFADLDPYRVFYRRYVHPEDYLWSKSRNKGDHPERRDFSEELWNRYDG